MEDRFTSAARADLARIRSWISRDNPERALSFVRELRQRAYALSDYPHRHPIVLKTSRGPVHKMTHRPYLIFYRVLRDSIEVIEVRHGARDMASFD